MATKVNNNIDFVVDDTNKFVGIQNAPGDVSSVLKLSKLSELRCVYNLSATNLLKWKAMRDAALDGALSSYTTPPAIAVLGNSISAGAGAGTGGTTNLIGAKARSGTTKLAKSLQARGIAARAGHFMSDQNVRAAASITYDSTAGTSYDPLLAYTGTTQWSQVTLGGTMIRSNTTGETISYTPPQTFDTVIAAYVKNAGLASVTVNVDGGATLATLVGAGTGGIASTTITGITEATHTVNLVSTAAAQFYLRSLRFGSSTSPAIDVVNYGWWGGVVNDFLGTSSAWSPRNVINANSDNISLVIIKLTTNDINGSTTVDTFTTQMGTLISAWQAVGVDVMLVTDEPFSGAGMVNGKAATFVAALKAAAITYNVPFVDLYAYYGSAYDAAPGQYFDSLHPSEARQAQTANVLADVLMVA